MRRSSPLNNVNKVAYNVNNVREYKYHQFDLQAQRIKRVHNKLMQRKQVTSSGNADINAIQKLLNPKMTQVFLHTDRQQTEEVYLKNTLHKEFFQDMNKLNGCFLDVVDNVCSYKVDLAMLLQKLVESYNSIFLQQYEVFYDGRLQKEIELEKEINAYNDKSKQRDEEKVKLQDKQEVVMKALMTKNNEIERLLE